MASRKPQLLFVDDESNVLHGIRRMLRNRRDRWDMAFATNGEDALRFLETTPADVVISDMRMPKMDGAALLHEVQRRHPETIRVVLSGYSEIEAILRTVGPSHQYIAKPCEADALIAVIERALALRAGLNSDPVRDLVTGLQSIPAMPGTLQDLMSEIASPGASVASVARLVANDVALTAQLLKLVNSAYFGLPRAVTKAKSAVSLLGLETVKALACMVNVFREFEGDERIRPDLARINRRSLKIGALAKAIASSDEFEANVAAQACCAGVLSHIGILPVLIELPERWAQAIDIIERTGGDMPEAERQAYGTDHAEIGGYILGIWAFNAEIVDAVKYHHAPSACGNPERGALTAVHVAQFLVRKDRDAYCGGAGLDMAYLERLGLVDHLPRWEETLQQLPGSAISL